MLRAQMKRPYLHPLLLSTLPHVLTLVAAGDCAAPTTPFPALAYPYLAVITTSSILSLLWHASFEAAGWVGFLDYAFAALWVAAEVSLAWAHGDTSMVVVLLSLNAFVTLTNLAVDQLARRSSTPLPFR